jgi:hypothetical protein
MSLTKITNRVIEPGTITANSLAEGISLGGGDDVIIDQIIITDENFANTEDTQILSSGGYLKIYGSGFQTNANVYFSNTFALTTQVTANVISSNEVRLTVGGISVDTYNLFLINTNGSIATKLNSIVIFLPQETDGWFGGGGPDASSTVDRITFATDTSTATIRGPLSLARQSLAATGNEDYGWFGGGYLPTTRSTVDRIDFADDTATATVRGPLSLARHHSAATGNEDYGWFGGGFLGINLPEGGLVSTVDRITFSADTATSTVRGPLSLQKRYLAATGNDNFGWFGGALANGPIISTVDRIEFVADTATASVRGPLSSAKSRLAATGNDNFGWFGGGSGISTVDRITFATDTSTATIRGPLSSVRSYFAATGNNDYGWFGGGRIPASVSSVDRITFAADTATASVRGPLSAAKYSFAATAGIV